MARKQTAIVDRGPDYSDPASWPQKVDDYVTALAILCHVWTQDRTYSVQDLSVMGQARFEVSRQRRLPSYYLQALRQIERRWIAREAARAAGTPFQVPGFASDIDAPRGGTPLDSTTAVDAQLTALADEAAGFSVRR